MSKALTRRAANQMQQSKMKYNLSISAAIFCKKEYLLEIHSRRQRNETEEGSSTKTQHKRGVDTWGRLFQKFLKSLLKRASLQQITARSMISTLLKFQGPLADKSKGIHR